MFATDRLVLRRFEDIDIDAMAALFGDSRVVKYIGDGHTLDREAVQQWIRQSQASHDRDGTGALAVVISATGQVIGYCGIEIGEDTGELELNYGFASQYWGQGFALEAASSVVAHADSFIDVLTATADPDNVASIRILDRLGFKHTHTALDIHGLPTAFFGRARSHL